MLVHSIYTFKDTQYISNIKKCLKKDGLLVIVADEPRGFLAKLKDITDKSYDTKRKDLDSVRTDLTSAGSVFEEQSSITYYSDCIEHGKLNEDGKLIVSWIALRDYNDIPKDILDASAEHFRMSSRNGRIEDEESFLFVRFPNDEINS
jgi:hypothetical protein